MTHPSRIGQDIVIQKPWRVILNGTGLYKPGTIFGKAAVAGTLGLHAWPPGLIFRDMTDTLDWWQVVEKEGKQVLVSLSGHGALRASGTGLVQDAHRGDSG